MYEKAGSTSRGQRFISHITIYCGPLKSGATLKYLVCVSIEINSKMPFFMVEDPISPGMV